MIHHAHNNFFEKTFSMLDVTADFLAQIPPKEIRDILDLSELKLLDKLHIHESLRKTQSDLIFETKLKTQKPIRIAILMEHKSSPPVSPHAQMMHYISSIQQQKIINEEPLIPVLPILFYHGKQKWRKKKFVESFPNLPKVLQLFIPSFDYLLINLKPSFLKNALFIMKHSSEEEFLKQNARKVFTDIDKIEDEEKQQILSEVLVSYLSYLIKVKTKEEMKQIAAQIPQQVEEKWISGVEFTFNRGKAEGKIEGKEIKGLIKDLNFTLTLLTKFPDLQLKKVAEYASVKLDFVKKIQKGFIEGDAKKARKTVFSFFKKFEDLSEQDTKEIEQILEKFVPFFQK